ncbi:MAG: HIT domain-containing protein [Desulfobaccales bacterium]
MQISKNNCPLCSVLKSSGSVKSAESCNTILLESNKFVVLSSIGPLTIGHVMVVSRGHYDSLSSMGIESIREYEDLYETISLTSFYKNKGILEVEHGATEDYCAGACVTHTHIHLIPSLSNYDNIFEGILARIPLNKLTDLSRIRKPYLLIRATGRPIRLYEAFDLPCQAIRRALCRVLGRDDWDWKIYPHYDLIDRTIEIWKNLENF